MNFGNRITQLFFMAVASLALMQASAMEVAGIKLDETARVANTDLKLNGAGIRYKLMFKVYVGSLYLSDKKTSTADVLALSGPKRVALTFVREVKADDFSKSFLDGLRKNTTAEERSGIFNQMLTFGQMFGTYHSVKEGDTITIDWIPNTGTVVSINGKRLADPLPDVTFYNALLKIWLGDQPADSGLKRGMLGGK